MKIQDFPNCDYSSHERLRWIHAENWRVKGLAAQHLKFSRFSASNVAIWSGSSALCRSWDVHCKWSIILANFFPDIHAVLAVGQEMSNFCLTATLSPGFGDRISKVLPLLGLRCALQGIPKCIFMMSFQEPRQDSSFVVSVVCFLRHQKLKRSAGFRGLLLTAKREVPKSRAWAKTVKNGFDKRSIYHKVWEDLWKDGPHFPNITSPLQPTQQHRC